MRPRSRITFLWSAFALAALATSLAVHRLYQTAQQEITGQSERALLQEGTRVAQRVQTYTEEVRRSIVAELASFHVDGLTQALRQWDEANEIILGTFQWDSSGGFPDEVKIPPGGPTRDELAQLWREFRTWRTAHPTNTSREPTKAGAWQTLAYHTVDNAAFTTTDLGYQSENLDITTHVGRRADPWAGWAASATTPDAPWVFWYQTGPDDAVRGCFVDVKPIVKQLRGELTDTAYAQLNFVEGAAAAPSAIFLPGLPAHRLIAEPGDVFHQKESRARFTVLIVAFLFALFLTGVVALTLYTRRASREAERKITFVTQVSHELRTPLTSIRLFADMLAEPGLPETKRVKFASTISTESGRLGALIERLLAFNALGKTNKKIARSKIEVGILVRDVTEEMEATLLAAGLRVTLDLPAGPVFAMTDSSTLKQALINLLDNAIKYAGGTGILKITLTVASNLVLLRVADQGPGIPHAIRDRVFEPFFQGGQTLTNKAPGVGLGLSLARGMLRQAGADLVLLDSTSGAVFEIQLPKAETHSI